MEFLEPEARRLLLEAGADPNDDQTIYNRHVRPDNDHLELLPRFERPAGRQGDVENDRLRGRSHDGAGGALGALTYGNNRFVATTKSAAGTLVVSTDGLTWMTESYSTNATHEASEAANNMVVVAGMDQGGFAYVGSDATVYSAAPPTQAGAATMSATTALYFDSSVR